MPNLDICDAYNEGFFAAMKDCQWEKTAANIIKYTGPVGQNAGQAADKATGFFGRTFQKVKNYFGNPMVPLKADVGPHPFFRSPDPNKKILTFTGAGAPAYRAEAERAILQKLEKNPEYVGVPNAFAGFGKGHSVKSKAELFRNHVVETEGAPSMFTGMMDKITGGGHSRNVYLDEMNKFFEHMNAAKSGTGATGKAFKDNTGLIDKLLTQYPDRKSRMAFHPDHLQRNTAFSPQEKEIINEAFASGVFNVSNKAKAGKTAGPYGDVFTTLEKMQKANMMPRDRVKAMEELAKRNPDYALHSPNALTFQQQKIQKLEQELQRNKEVQEMRLKAKEQIGKEPPLTDHEAWLKWNDRRKQIEEGLPEGSWSQSMFMDLDERQIKNLKDRYDRAKAQSDDFDQLLESGEKSVRNRRYLRNTAIGAVPVAAAGLGLKSAFSDDKNRRRT